jgi:hypothetical protein
MTLHKEELAGVMTLHKEELAVMKKLSLTCVCFQFGHHNSTI